MQKGRWEEYESSDILKIPLHSHLQYIFLSQLHDPFLGLGIFQRPVEFLNEVLEYTTRSFKLLDVEDVARRLVSRRGSL